MLKRYFAALFALLGLLTNHGVPQENRCAPAVTGTFLQAWYCADWDASRWAQETAYMKEAGMEYLILQTTASLENGAWTVWYPSALPAFQNARQGDVLEQALKSCDAAGIRVFVGLADFDDWWGKGGFSREYRPVCELMAEMQREIYERYHPLYGDTLCGWYFAPEIDNIPTMKLSVRRIAAGLNVVLDTAGALDPAMPVMLSPYFTESYAVPSVVFTLPMWHTFFEAARFRPGDIFAPQDAVGAGWTKEKHIEKVWQMYRAAVDASDRGVVLWANCENFAPGEGGNAPADMDRFTRQLAVAARYTDRIVCFSMNHFYSPYIDAVAYDAYLRYLTALG